ncbi:N-acetylmuramoyl-L-alanine amidase [Cytobacillus eiseniae]|uniref:N-acetylmuramoyl-L-alanine amidase n=1 Tax=Cytobacillus eiseniae TaxID=762947 RepID=A0ABS4RHK1_9BACI|nr:N-acetylmuramoyl-L-alanine amidase [Cytobacillus eiseniae]MBP2242361.1 N-acetylmuramoyl-L-alanine amidase [Cytobacillus eiseniae]
MAKFFIDPGHGGTDVGAVANGLQEKNLTLAIAKKIRDFLLQYENTEVRLSRDTDKTLSLKQRTDMANAWGADYLISVHINAGGGTGFESYIHTNASKASVNFQNIIHPEIVKQLDFTDRGKKRANFHMVRESNMPAILTENGFIDTQADANKLKQDAYITRIAQGHVNGVVEAFRLKKKGGSTVAEQKLTAAQEKVRQEAIRLGITDGKNPFREANQFYVWACLVPLAQRIEELEKKL